MTLDWVPRGSLGRIAALGGFLAAVGCLAEGPGGNHPEDGDCLSTGLSQDGQERCYQADAVAAFRAKEAINPLEVDSDPYDEDAVLPDCSGDGVCAIQYESGRVKYRLQSFSDEESARQAGFTVTHRGTCGTCSTLADLAVYLERADLTTPVRACAVNALFESKVLGCLADLGFTAPCAQTWYYNALNTARSCLTPCLAVLAEGTANNLPDGSLNPCLACDEERSGPIFKCVSGRTRRNSGIRSAIDRGESDIYPVTHDYY